MGNLKVGWGGQGCQKHKEIFHNTLNTTDLPILCAFWSGIGVNPQQKLKLAASRTLLNHTRKKAKVTSGDLNHLLPILGPLLAFPAAHVSTRSLFSFISPVLCLFPECLPQLSSGLVNLLELRN